MKASGEMTRVDSTPTTTSPHAQRYLAFYVYGLHPFSLVMKHFSASFSIFAPYAIIFPHGSPAHLGFNGLYWGATVPPLVLTLAPIDRERKNAAQLRLSHVIDGVSASAFCSSVITGALKVTTQEAIPLYIRNVVLTEGFALLGLLPLEYLDYQMRNNRRYPLVIEIPVRLIYRSLKFATAPTAFLSIFVNNLKWWDQDVIWITTGAFFGARLLLEIGLLSQALERREANEPETNVVAQVIENVVQNGFLRGVGIASLTYVLAAGYYAIAHQDEDPVSYLEGLLPLPLVIFLLYFVGSILEYLQPQPQNRVELLAEEDEDQEEEPVQEQHETQQEEHPQVTYTPLPATSEESAQKPKLLRTSDSGNSFLDKIGGNSQALVRRTVEKVGEYRSSSPELK